MVVRTRRQGTRIRYSSENKENEMNETKESEDEELGKGEKIKVKENEKPRKDEKKKTLRKIEDTQPIGTRKRKHSSKNADEGENESAFTHLGLNQKPEIVDKRNKCNNQNEKLWIIILKSVLKLTFSVVLILIAGNSTVYFSANGDTVNSTPQRDIFRKHIDLLSKSFPNQTQYLWKLVGSASIDFIESENPKRPAVILLAGGPTANVTLNRLAYKLSECYTTKGTLTEINGTQYKNKDSDRSKNYIDKTLKNGFNDGNRVAVIYHLESVPARASMIFHSYCETDNAPFKKVVIIFTVHMKEELNPNDNVKLNQKKVEQHLENQWKSDVDKDHIEAMFSRVATATAFVTPE